MGVGERSLGTIGALGRLCRSWWPIHLLHVLGWFWFQGFSSQRIVITIHFMSKVCVCVNRLNRRKTCTFWFAICCHCFLNLFAGVPELICRGQERHVSLLPTKTLTIDGDTRLGQSGVPAVM